VRKNGHFPRVAGVAACALTLGAAGCGGGNSASHAAGASTAGDASYLAAVTRAVAATDRVPGYKIAINTNATIGGKSVKGTGSGYLDARGTEGAITLGVEGKRVTELVDKPYVYLQTPEGAKASVTHGRSWLRVDLATFTQSYGEGQSDGASTDPAQELGYLKAAGTVTRIGAGEVRGVASTHYRAIVDLDRLAAAAPPDQRAAAKRAGTLIERVTGAKTFPMDVWIGGGRVTRLSYTLSLCTTEGRLSESLQTELFDYGREPVVSPPPASQVTDIDARVKAAIAKALTQLSCH
jgi:hypothetical protein